MDSAGVAAGFRATVSCAAVVATGTCSCHPGWIRSGSFNRRPSGWVTVASAGQHCPVVRLVTDAEPFDTVQFARLDPSCMQVVGHDVTPFGTARFAFVRRTSTGGEQVVEEITTGQPV